MIELEVHTVAWCQRQQHATLVLRTRGHDRLVAVVASAEDAAAVDAATVPAGRLRAYTLIELAVAHLEAVLTAVELVLSPAAQLSTVLHLDGPAGPVQLPAHVADGIVLAQRNEVPLLIAPDVLARIPEQTGLASPAPAAPPLPAVFADFIATLDLSALDT